MMTIAFFNNKGGVGKTSLVYHLTWMFAHLGIKVIAADLDPQANLSAMFIEEERLEQIWPDNLQRLSILGALMPLIEGTGDIQEPHVEQITERIGLIVGDLGLSRIEDDLSSEWPNCLDRKPRSFRVISAFYRILEQATQSQNAHLALIDVGPNLGAINRAAVIAADHVVVPLAPDLFSLQGLRNLGPSLRAWRTGWSERIQRAPETNLHLPNGSMKPAGYVIMQHNVRLDRPVKAYNLWMNRIPSEYRQAILDEDADLASPVINDPHCLASIKHYRSLMPMAMEARKPIFALKPADGALGAHQAAVQECFADFKVLAQRIAQNCQVVLPPQLSQTTLF